MKKKTIYRQCELLRLLPDNESLHQVSYLPMQYARLGRVLRLKNGQDLWEDGWEVVLVGNSVSSDDLPDSHKQIKSHRNNTGDSLRR